MYLVKPELEPLPMRIKKLDVDSRGYPIPWFVAYVDGPAGPNTVADFRVMDRQKWIRAVKERLCWVCGEPLGKWLVFTIGPMCAVTRTTAEPPAHLECAQWSIKHCPFLSQPKMVRNEVGLPPEGVTVGVMLSRNPGVTCIWTTRNYEVFDSGNGPLITVGEPDSVTWWREGREATREEVQTSIDGGFPNLLALAKQDGQYALQHLDRQMALIAERWMPREVQAE